MGNYYDDAGNLLYGVESTPLVFETLAEFRKFPAKDNTNWAKGRALAILLGGTTVFDQAFKIYAWNAASSAGDNGTSVIKPTNVTTGRWVSP